MVPRASFSDTLGLFQVGLTLLRFITSLMNNSVGYFGAHSAWRTYKYLISYFVLFYKEKFNTMRFPMCHFCMRAEANCRLRRDFVSRTIYGLKSIVCSSPFWSPRLRPESVGKLPGLSGNNPSLRVWAEQWHMFGKLVHKSNPNAHRQYVNPWERCCCILLKSWLFEMILSN